MHRAGQIEFDIGAFERESTLDTSRYEQGGLATADYAPPQPSLEVQTALGDFYEYEVLIYDVERGRRLVAASELINPGKKDCPETRGQFVSRCATLQRSGVYVKRWFPWDFNEFSYPAWIRTMNERSKIFSVTITPRGSGFLQFACRKANRRAENFLTTEPSDDKVS